jgi:hypothetical protein
LSLDYIIPKQSEVKTVHLTGYLGNEKQILVPIPYSESTQIRPPCASTIALDRYKPKPAPFVSRAIEGER